MKFLLLVVPFLLSSMAVAQELQITPTRDSFYDGPCRDCILFTPDGGVITADGRPNESLRRFRADGKEDMKFLAAWKAKVKLPPAFLSLALTKNVLRGLALQSAGTEKADGAEVQTPSLRRYEIVLDKHFIPVSADFRPLEEAFSQNELGKGAGIISLGKFAIVIQQTERNIQVRKLDLTSGWFDTAFGEANYEYPTCPSSRERVSFDIRDHMVDTESGMGSFLASPRNCKEMNDGLIQFSLQSGRLRNLSDFLEIENNRGWDTGEAKLLPAGENSFYLLIVQQGKLLKFTNGKIDTNFRRVDLNQFVPRVRLPAGKASSSEFRSLKWSANGRSILLAGRAIGGPSAGYTSYLMMAQIDAKTGALVRDFGRRGILWYTWPQSKKFQNDQQAEAYEMAVSRKFGIAINGFVKRDNEDLFSLFRVKPAPKKKKTT